MSVNKVILIGNLGVDPEVKTLANGVKVANFSLATTSKYTNKSTGEKVEDTEWHRITMWRELAGVAESYLKKGDKVYLEGKLSTEVTETEGVKRYYTSVVCDQLVMLGGKKNEESTF